MPRMLSTIADGIKSKSRGCTPSIDAIQHNARGFASFWGRGGLGPSTIVPLQYMICNIRHCFNDIGGGALPRGALPPLIQKKKSNQN